MDSEANLFDSIQEFDDTGNLTSNIDDENEHETHVDQYLVVANDLKNQLRTPVYYTTSFRQTSNPRTPWMTDDDGQNHLQCTVCAKVFSKESKLLAHTRIHDREKPHQCKVCKKVFRWASSLKRHVKIHTGEKNHNCPVCDKSFRERSHVREHLKTHTGEKSFRCAVCCTAFSRIYSLKEHEKIHLGERQENSNDGERPYICWVCEKSCDSGPKLKQHFKAHFHDSLYKCIVCDKEFRKYPYVKAHLNTHIGERPFKCTVCKKSYVEKYYLKMHMTIHTGERHYKCMLCEKSFNRLSVLKIHSATHSEERPYKCSSCDKSFTTSWTAKRHAKTHAEEKLRQCPICEKSFSRPGSPVEHHLKLHCIQDDLALIYRLTAIGKTNTCYETSIEKEPYRCKVCGELFKQVDCLQQHIVEHFGIEQVINNELFNDEDATAENEKELKSPRQSEICGMTLSSSSSCAGYSYSERPYGCGLCFNTFLTKDQTMEHFYSHLKDTS